MVGSSKFHNIGFLLWMTMLIAVLSLCAAMLPWTYPLVAVVNSLLLTVFILKGGFAKAFLAPVLSLLLVYLVTFQILSAITAVLCYLLPGLLFALCMRRGFSMGKTILLVGIGYLAYCFLDLYFVSAAAKMSISGYLYTTVNTFVKTAQQNINAVLGGGGNADILAIAQQLMMDADTLTTQILSSIPSALIMAAALIAYIIITLGKAVLRRFSVDVSFLADFKDLRLERAFSVLMVFSFFGILIFRSGVIATVLSNMLVIFTAMLSFCGFTLIDYFMFSKGLQRPLRILILVALFLVVCVGFAGLYFVSLAIMLLGLFDTSFHFRRWLGKGDGQNGQA